MSAKNVETFRIVHNAFNQRDQERLFALLSPDFRYEDRARGVGFTGRSGFSEFLNGWTRAFSDAKVTNPVYIDGGDAVVALFNARGTNNGALGSLPPTNRKLDLPFCEILRFNAEGKIISGEIYYDQLTLLKQLGQREVASVTV